MSRVTLAEQWSRRRARKAKRGEAWPWVCVVMVLGWGWRFITAEWLLCFLFTGEDHMWSVLVHVHFSPSTSFTPNHDLEKTKGSKQTELSSISLRFSRLILVFWSHCSEPLCIVALQGTNMRAHNQSYTGRSHCHCQFAKRGKKTFSLPQGEVERYSDREGQTDRQTER